MTTHKFPKLSASESIRRDMAQGAEERAKEKGPEHLLALLERAGTYVTDSLEAHEHSDGRDLLIEIDEALRPDALYIPKTKPDPLVEVIAGWTGGTVLLASDLCAALEARGLEIWSKNDD